MNNDSRPDKLKRAKVVNNLYAALAALGGAGLAVGAIADVTDGDTSSGEVAQNIILGSMPFFAAEYGFKNNPLFSQTTHTQNSVNAIKAAEKENLSAGIQEAALQNQRFKNQRMAGLAAVGGLGGLMGILMNNNMEPSEARQLRRALDVARYPDEQL